MTLKTFRLFLIAACLCGFVTAAAAQQDAPDDITLSRADAARAAAALSLTLTLEQEVEALKRQLALVQQIDALNAQLLATMDKVVASETRLRELAEKERDVYKARAERIEGEGEKSTRWLRCRANGGLGAVIGFAAGTAIPVAGNLGGAAVGFLGGCVAGLLGAP